MKPSLKRIAFSTDFWSAGTRHRFSRLAGSPAGQSRVQRIGRTPRATVFDGDKSPAESGENSPHSMSSWSSRQSISGFTMIEIAIAIAVIGFALVAIIGILPRGMQVQRDNRSETILNQDGTFWLEAIRNGAQGLNELPRHVTQIDIKDENGNAIGASPYNNFNSGAEIIGLLTTQAVVTNAHVTAQVFAISGAASEKALNVEEQELAFRYRLRVQIHQSTNTALSFLETTTLPVVTNEPLATLYDLKVELGYPIGSGNQTPSRKLAFRSLVSRNVKEYFETSVGATNYFFVP